MFGGGGATIWKQLAHRYIIAPLVAYFLLGQHKSLSVTSSPIPQIRGKVIGLFTMIHFNIAPKYCSIVNKYCHILVQDLALKNCMHPVHLLIDIALFFYRDRIAHLLAVRPYKKPELLLRIQRGTFITFFRCQYLNE